MLYRTLKVHRKAMPEEIRASYHKLALEFHPDKCGGSHEDFLRIQKAYEILMDPEKRAEYDEMMAKKREKMRNFVRPEPFMQVVNPVGYKLADDKYYLFETAPQKVRCGLRYGDIIEFQRKKGCFVGLSADSFLYWCSEGHDYATPFCHAASDFALSSTVVLLRSNLDGGKVHVAPPPKQPSKNPVSSASKMSSSTTTDGGNRKSKAKQIWEQLRFKEKLRMISQQLKDAVTDEIDARKALESEYSDRLKEIQSEMVLASRDFLPAVLEEPEVCEVAPSEGSAPPSAPSFPPSSLEGEEKDDIAFRGGMAALRAPLSPILRYGAGTPGPFSLGPPTVVGDDDERAGRGGAIPRSLRLSTAPTETECGSLISNEGINGTQCNDESEDEESSFQIHFVTEMASQGGFEGNPTEKIPDLFETYGSKNGETMNTVSQPGVSAEPSIESLSSEVVLPAASLLTASRIEPLRHAAPPQVAQRSDSDRSSSNSSGGTVSYREPWALPHRSFSYRNGDETGIHVNDFAGNQTAGGDAERFAGFSTHQTPNGVFSPMGSNKLRKDEDDGAAGNGMKGKTMNKKPPHKMRKDATKKPLNFVKIDADGVLRISKVENPAKGAARIRSFNRLSAEELFQQEVGFIEEFMSQGKNGKRRR
ncbi:unnamed protein product [Phytomonas sp. EM1]|nr:unnamed protein product [Phytomonas sp. EM1]|eukprot:CCW61638.1 unnamed protein product [Phytomonas sp. isolate EM1]